MSNIKKFVYTTGDLFTLSGNYVLSGKYTGYYNIANNQPYVGKFTQDIPLNVDSNVYSAVVCSDLFFNRLPGENFSLTYSLSDFIFQPGEFINSSALDNKLAKMYINYLDTYRACFMASSNLPYKFVNVFSVQYTASGYQLSASSGSIGNYVYPLSTINPAFTRISKIAFGADIYTPNYTLIFANPTNLVTYRVLSGFTTLNPLFSSQYVETNTPDYGVLTFNDITSISLYNTSLFVCDSGSNTVYGYDASGVLQEDIALQNKFVLVNSVNGTQGGFSNATLVCASSALVYVYDAGTQTVFYYDYNFNLINSYKNSNLFATSQPVCLAYYQVYDQLYILTQDYNLVILDNQANATVIQLPMNVMQQGEVALKMIFSNSNSDIFYLLTNYNLYKRFVSNPINNIGNYSFVNNITGTNTNNYVGNLYDVSILNTLYNSDQIALYGFDQIINYNEVTLFNSIVK